MDNTARDELVTQVLEDLTDSYEEQEHTECDIVEFRSNNSDRDSSYENFVNEIDAWARQALAANGFGDY
jgi:hypothetical protein